VNLKNERVLQMVMDSLRYWVQECHVDGFRFDLCSTLGRDRDIFDPSAVFFDTIRQDPVLSAVKMIAEPWDTGPNGYQVGNYPPLWAEWNDKYRDTVRGYWKGDDGLAGDLAGNLLGAANLFEKRGRKPWASVNFITAHDGFTLNDLVTYNDKHNEANGEDNKDGHSHNLSWNCGAEGETDDQDILNLRDRMRRNLVATTLLSQGTPMLLMGDEIGRSQGGNNNSYCQDMEMNWLQWEGIGERDQAFRDFVANVIAIRKSRTLIGQRKFLHADPVDDQGTLDVQWLRPSGEAMEQGDWENGLTRSMTVMLANAEERLAILFNAHYQPLDFNLPAGHESGWTVLIDSALGIAKPKGGDKAEGTYTVEGRSLILLESRK
jgi:isoamylase